MKRIISSTLLVIAFVTVSINESDAGLFAAMGQTVIYDTVGGSGSVSATENGVTYTFSYSGSTVIGVQNECELAFDICNSSAQNITFTDGTKIGIDGIVPN